MNKDIIVKHCIKSERYDKCEAISVFLHGYGDCADNFLQIANYFAKRFDNRIILVPNAIIDIGYGYAWFLLNNLYDMSYEDIAIAINNLDKIFQKFLNDIVEKYKCEKIEIFGFSQGAMLALRSIYLSKNIKTIIASSGILVGGDEVLSKNANIFITHGRNDDIVDFKFGEHSFKKLSNIGMCVKLLAGDYDHSLDGMIGVFDSESF